MAMALLYGPLKKLRHFWKSLGIHVEGLDFFFTVGHKDIAHAQRVHLILKWPVIPIVKLF